jgi:hypothetical protein
MFARVVTPLVTLFSFACLASCAVAPAEESASTASTSEVKLDCAAVLCALPDCAPNQHLATHGGCCPICVGGSSRCATVMCAAVVCPEGEQLVTSNGDCCGHCAKAPAVKECTTADDCPQYYCIQCPCPVSECVGRKCVTHTPDISTCGGSTL